MSKSIARLRELEGIVAGGGVGLTKKEVLNLTRERDKLDRSLGGIASMGGVPGPHVRDRHQQGSHRHQGSPQARHPGGGGGRLQLRSRRSHFPIPGNDDAARAIQLYCDLIADAVLDGLTESQVRGGADIGASARPPVEPASCASRAPYAPVESPIDGPTGANYWNPSNATDERVNQE